MVYQALDQVTHFMWDPTWLPLVSVGNVFAAFKHDIEVGLLTSYNTTQWSLNWLSASQVAMDLQATASQSTGGSQEFR